MMDRLVLLFIIFIAFAGFYLRSLTVSGALAAVAVGTAVYLGFQVKGLLLLGLFFASSSLWSKYKSSSKAAMEEVLAKGSVRNWQQVLANGGTAAALSLLYWNQHHPVLLLAFLIALASANSDTWASEIGSLSRKNPLSVATFKRVERGTSGAISLLGSVAALLGALLIAIMGFLLFKMQPSNFWLVFIFGYVGNGIDTLLGAYIQQDYQCTICGINTEKRKHCNQPTTIIKGSHYIGNDMVNFLSGLFAVILALGLFQLFS